MKLETGSIGEKCAVTFLKDRGYEILKTNYKKPYGEVDIVSKKAEIIHFIEVKTSQYFPESGFSPEIRVNARKIRNLKKICETYFRETNVSRDQKWQIDVISVILDQNGALKDLNFIENAVFEEKY